MAADVRLRGNIDYTVFPVNIDSVKNILQTIQHHIIWSHL